MDEQKSGLTRRSFLGKALLLSPMLVLAACGGQTLDEIMSEMRNTTTQRLPATPICGDDDDDDVTVAQTEGPYYTPNSPQRVSFLEAGITGTPLLVAGYVLSTDCRPIPQALVDFWHCDDAGIYDNAGYKLRGHQFTDANGLYMLETILPGLYPGRTRHIHVKVQVPNQPVLTTQLYFPNEAANASDGIYNPALEVTMSDAQMGTFNFVLDV